eukprot:861108_1
MSLCEVLFTTMMVLTYRCSSLWMEGSSQLPRGDSRFVVGYDVTADTILLFGGFQYGRQFVKFKDHQFTDEGQNYLDESQTTGDTFQHYTQLGNDLWMIHGAIDTFILIDTQTYVATTLPITFPHERGCLTSTSGFLIVISLNYCQIYDINNDEWLSGVPSLTKGQKNTACAVVNDKVYVIGGKDSDGVKLKSIQELDVSTLPTTTDLSWNDFPCSLGTARTGLRAAIRGTDIYVMGGFLGDSIRSQDVDIIDTFNRECHISDPLAFGTSYAASIIVNDVLYTFGGTDDAAVLRKEYQYTVLPTTSPTKYPTSAPNEQPIMASTTPSTMDPSVSPTSQTEERTNGPSTTPTSASPTKDKSPTLVAAGTPSKSPTVALDNETSENDMATTRMNDLKTTWIGKEGGAKASVDVALIVIVAICIVTLVSIIVLGRALLRMIKESKTDEENICSEVSASHDVATNHEALAVVDTNTAVTGQQDIVMEGLEIMEDITSGYPQNDIANACMNDMEVIDDDDIANDTINTMDGENEESDTDDQILPGIETLRASPMIMDGDTDNEKLPGIETLRASPMIMDGDTDNEKLPGIETLRA